MKKVLVSICLNITWGDVYWFQLEGRCRTFTFMWHTTTFQPEVSMCHVSVASFVSGGVFHHLTKWELCQRTVSSQLTYWFRKTKNWQCSINYQENRTDSAISINGCEHNAAVTVKNEASNMKEHELCYMFVGPWRYVHNPQSVNGNE